MAERCAQRTEHRHVSLEHFLTPDCAFGMIQVFLKNSDGFIVGATALRSLPSTTR